MDFSQRNIIQNNELVDSNLLAFGWMNDGENFWAKFSLTDDTTIKILFLWATNLIINMDYKEYSGMPLIYSTSLKQTNKGFCVHIVFGVAPEGFITLECNDIQIV